MKKKTFIFALILFSLISNTFLYGEDTTPEPYKKDEFPQVLKDIRRFEIITLGSLPFVTLDATLAYSGYRYAQHNFDPAYQIDIFNKSSFTTDEQKGIVLTSIGISAGIGLADYVVQLIKRSKKNKKDKIRYEDINVYPISEDPEATLIKLPNETTEEELDVSLIEEEVPEVDE